MAHVLEGTTVLDPEGRRIPFEQLWTDRLAVLVFVRHFGCIFCRQQIVALRPVAERVRSLGGEIIIVGNGTTAQAHAFSNEQKTPFQVFTDPERQAYRALGMRRGVRSVMSPGVFTRTVGAWRQGFRQWKIAGDPLQQGGVVIVGPGGVEYYRFISREAGDHPPAGEILAAVESAARVRKTDLGVPPDRQHERAPGR